MEKATEDHWRELSEEILTDMKEWRKGHPKAMFREIEDEVHTRMSRLEAQLIQQRRDGCVLEKDMWGVKIIWAQD
jgi:hypothetical protein